MALLTKVRTTMAIHAHRKVRGLLDGEYASVATGRSMDFHDLREYVAGDDVKDLDWKASARRGDLLVRRYVADRKHTILIVAATGRSMAALANPSTSKRDLAVLISGIMGWLALRHGDRVGLLIGDTEACHSVRPGATEVALERMLQHIHDGCSPTAPPADLAALLAYAVRTVRRRTIMVVIADDTPITADVERQLRRLRAQHEVLFVTLADLDPTDPSLGDEAVADVELGELIPAFIRGDVTLHQELRAATDQRDKDRRRALERLGIAGEHLTGTEGIVAAVFRLLERHRHAGR